MEMPFSIYLPAETTVRRQGPRRVMGDPGKTETFSLPNYIYIFVFQDGKVTETVLSFPYALQAGKMEIVKVEVQDNGAVVVVGNAEVGATVTLDWKEGNEHELITG